MRKFTKSCISASLAVGLSMLAGGAIAHSGGTAAGAPTCLESNIMMADAMNAPFSNIPGPGRVLEMNITTGERGITVPDPFTLPGVMPGDPLCPVHVSCPGPMKPTGIVSGGENGHAFLTSAAQHAMIEHHRDGTAIRTSPLWPTDPSPDSANQVGPAKGHGWVPRLLGNGFMPNGNIAQTTCDANFFNAPNSDMHPDGTLVANDYFPPVNGTTARSSNGRVIVIDQNTLEVIDEYSKPTKGPFANDPRWNCPAGVLFTSEGLFVSMFHGDAIFVIDWKAGVDKQSRGVGANVPSGCGSSSDDDGDGCVFKLDKKKNEAVVLRVIDLEDPDGNGAPDMTTGFDSGHRRDNLRAIRMSEDGSLYGTRRSRDAECGANAGCNPGNFRQHIFIVDPGASHNSGNTIALDPGINVIAGVTINRMSAVACEAINPGHTDLDICDVETLYVGVSSVNPGCTNTGPVMPNPCFTPGATGALLEYRIDADHLDGGSAWGGGACTGAPNAAGADGCALPIAQFDFVNRGTSGIPLGDVETLDPRMVMTVHEAFVQ